MSCKECGHPDTNGAGYCSACWNHKKDLVAARSSVKPLSKHESDGLAFFNDHSQGKPWRVRLDPTNQPTPEIY